MNFLTNIFKITSFGFLYSGPVYAIYKNELLNFKYNNDKRNTYIENENEINKFTNDIGRGYILYLQNLSNIHKFINYDIINKIINEIMNEQTKKNE